jgi:hypothetical protein
MMFMNTYEIDEAVARRQDHPTLGPATQTLANLRDMADRNSDGWCYWPKPSRAAAKLQQLINGDGTWEAKYGDRDEVTAAQVRAAYVPIKAFLTRSGLTCEIVAPT